MRVYSGLLELVLDGNDYQAQSEKDGLGRLIAVREYYRTHTTPPGRRARRLLLPEWLRPIVRRVVKEGQVLDALKYAKNTKTVKGIVDGEVVGTIPDFIDDAGKLVGEIKDVAELKKLGIIEIQYIDDILR